MRDVFYLKVFPDEFIKKPSLHVLHHLPDQARYFGTLRNTSVAVKEMAHRIYKDAVLCTNKQNIQRDLTAFENVMQAIHFALEGFIPINQAPPGEGVRCLLRSSLLESLYIPKYDIQEPPVDYEDLPPLFECDRSVSEIRIFGRYTKAEALAINLPSMPLSLPHMGELMLAYKEQGDNTIKLARNVAYFRRVRYRIESSVEDNIIQDIDRTPVIISVGDICSVLVEGQMAWVKVIAIMRHLRSVFLVIRWFATTGRTHRRLHMEEYRLCNLFEYTAFFSLKTVDHQIFVNSVYFHYDKDADKYYKNDWIFRPV